MCRPRSPAAAGARPRSRCWVAEPRSPGGQGRGRYAGPLPGPASSPLSPRLTRSTPSASTSRAQVPGFSTKGSPRPLWGTVTKAGSVLGGKATGWLCSVPGDTERETPRLPAHGPPWAAAAPGPGCRLAPHPLRGLRWGWGEGRGAGAGQDGQWGSRAAPRHSQLLHVANLPSSCTETRPLTLVGPRLT